MNISENYQIGIVAFLGAFALASYIGINSRITENRMRSNPLDGLTPDQKELIELSAANNNCYMLSQFNEARCEGLQMQKKPQTEIYIDTNTGLFNTRAAPENEEVVDPIYAVLDSLTPRQMEQLTDAEKCCTLSITGCTGAPRPVKGCAEALIDFGFLGFDGQPKADQSDPPPPETAFLGL